MLAIKKLISTLSIKANARHLSFYENYLEIESIHSVASSKFHYFWLRDHCRCSKCYNHNTHQVNHDVKQIPFNIKPESCEISDNKLKIIWPDGHKTEYSLNLLKTLFENRMKPLREIVYWDKAKISNLNDTSVPYKEYIESRDGLASVVKSILKYGFGIVTEVEPTMAATEKVARRLGIVQKTIFGEMWELSNSAEAYQDHQDTAYSPVALGAHNDNTYFSEATGLMMFHMLERQGTGGKTLLVDGWNAANNLRKVDKSAFDVLCHYPLESEYIENNYYYTSVEPVIKLHPVTKDIFQMRYNIYDRAYLNSLPFEHIMDFYKAYVSLGKEITKESNEWWIQLEPGSLIFFDNWRILHGRGEYTGKRRLAGCYIARKDWISTAKFLGLPLY